MAMTKSTYVEKYVGKPIKTRKASKANKVKPTNYPGVKKVLGEGGNITGYILSNKARYVRAVKGTKNSSTRSKQSYEKKRASFIF